MCSTPAPPSTALVATCIWSGVGEVNTSPGQAASSMPGPTKPPCMGSCPDPPPDTRPTLPATGASALTMTAGSVRTLSRSPCASATPCSASLTTSAGSLISFFIFRASCALLELAATSAGRTGHRAGARPAARPDARSGSLAGRAFRARLAFRYLLRDTGGLGLQPGVQDVADEEVVEDDADDAADERPDDWYPEVIAEVESGRAVAPW